MAGGGLGTLIAGGVLLIGTMAQGGMGTFMGPSLLAILEWLSFAGVVASGVFLTADCLSEEKREGTLGLLFLTDLRGHDVVLGKLLATSLRAAQGLVAVFPVLGLPLLLGGVSGGEFWRVVLVLGNTLFFSLALGLGVSSISRDALKAMTATLGWTALFLFVPLLMDVAVAEGKGISFEPFFSVASPGFALSQAGVSRLDNYWLSLAVTHALGWMFLGLACLCVPRTWQQKAAAPPWRIRWRVPAWLGESPAKRAARRGRALDRDPVAWLSARDLWLHCTVPAFVFLGIGLYALGMSRDDQSDVSATGLVFFYVLAVPFGLWVAAQASRFLTEGRRTGLLELLLATPVTGAEIVRGHWWALRRLFLMPTIALLALLACASLFQIFGLSGFSVRGSPQGALIAWQVVAGVLGLAGFVTGLGALAWFGIWMGLTSRSTTVAVLKTVAFVKVLPWLALMFLQGMFMALFALAMIPGGKFGMSGEWIMVVPSLVMGFIGIGVDITFIVVARRKVTAHFREYVALEGRIEYAPVKLPPPVVSPEITPPPIPAD